MVISVVDISGGIRELIPFIPALIPSNPLDNTGPTIGMKFAIFAIIAVVVPT